MRRHYSSRVLRGSVAAARTSSNPGQNRKPMPKQTVVLSRGLSARHYPGPDHALTQPVATQAPPDRKPSHARLLPICRAQALPSCPPLESAGASCGPHILVNPSEGVGRAHLLSCFRRFKPAWYLLWVRRFRCGAAALHNCLAKPRTSFAGTEVPATDVATNPGEHWRGNLPLSGVPLPGWSFRVPGLNSRRLASPGRVAGCLPHPRWQRCSVPRTRNYKVYLI